MGEEQRALAGEVWGGGSVSLAFLLGALPAWAGDCQDQAQATWVPGPSLGSSSGHLTWPSQGNPWNWDLGA